MQRSGGSLCAAVAGRDDGLSSGRRGFGRGPRWNQRRWSGVWLSVLLDEEAPHRVGALGGFKVAFGGADDRALHEEVPGPREGVGVAEAGFGGHGGHKAANVFQVVDAGSAGGVRGAISNRTLMKTDASKSSL